MYEIRVVVEDMSDAFGVGPKAVEGTFYIRDREEAAELFARLLIWAEVPKTERPINKELEGQYRD